MNDTSANSIEHRQTWDLIPWYVTARLGDRDNDRVTAHLRNCAECQQELATQRVVYQGISGTSSVEHLPAASLQRLRQRLATTSAASTESAPTPVPLRVRRPSPRPVLWTASAAAIAMASGAIAIVFWNSPREFGPGASYHTVTTTRPATPNAVIRAVFAPTLTMSQLQVLLAESQLTLVSGPSEAGVYSLASTSVQSVNALLSRLRGNPEVRFAEAIGPLAGAEQ